MYIKVGDEFADSDLEFLRDLLEMLDLKLRELQSRADQRPGDDSSGIHDWCDFLAGTGFVACQRFLAATYGPHGVAKETALAIGPQHNFGKTIAAILNAAANLWKHQDEWGIYTMITRDVDVLGKRERKTVNVIESVTPWSDYTFANLLFELTGEVQFAGLMPKLEEWRRQLDAAKSMAGGVARSSD